ncbi:hypothetical protein LARI1_G006393 [Lachnellula arida]|uniref:Uncharacterized protein n=1 Tax=Lachnellula arida TaxID=1316785 RepID=A0A8T9B4F4_9HELO|nr:hypothetical protein LARI1_G006393 [Lachnellula arida]
MSGTPPRSQMPSSTASPIDHTASGNSGPSPKDPALITSTWGIGWKTPFSMIACYFIAVMIAISHLLLFRYIDGKEADGPHRVAPQSYITTASNILANVFGFALRAALAIAFAQYLWHIFRVSTMKVSTIELLFTIRTNIFMLLRPVVIQTSPVLFALSVLVWASQVVTSFPPGAITVITSQKTTYEMRSVPNYDATFMGNKSGADAERYSLTGLVVEPGPDGGFSTLSLPGKKDESLIQRLTVPVLVKGEAFTFPSPCGINCSYSTQFEGPYLECNTTSTTYNQTKNYLHTIYAASYSDPRSSIETETCHDGFCAPYNGTYSIAAFNFTVLTPLAMDSTNASNISLLIREDQLFCSPARANYTINNTYINNIHTRTISTAPVDRLINLAPASHDSEVLVPNFGSSNSDRTGLIYGTTPANWSAYATAYYRDMNHISLIESMMYYLNGTTTAYIPPPGDTSQDTPNKVQPSSSLTDGNFTRDVTWSEPQLYDASGNFIKENSLLAPSTRLNSNFGHFNPNEPGSPAFSISQDLLNEQLLNVTLSMMLGIGLWNTTANATISSAINVYDFSEPLMLILPYFITLAVAVPFILLGGLALFKNGVSAIDGGFLQIVATSTGSAVLDHAAAGGCLGGDESVAQELKDLKVRFGEFIGRQEPGRIRRAGFGVETEVTALKKGALYGTAKWI